MTQAELTIFYDGFCPLCVAEMSKLRKLDKAQKLAFEDIQQADFSARYPGLDWHALNFKIHALQADGNLLQGLDATHQAWKLVGHGWLYAPLRWPIISWFADRAYLFFARNRYQISYWLTGQKRCDSNQCNPH